MLAYSVSYGWGQAGTDLAQISPILCVSVAMLVAMVADLVLPAARRGAIAAGISLVGLLAAIVAALLLYQSRGQSAYSGFATWDDFAVYFLFLFSLRGIIAILVAPPFLVRRTFLHP